MTNIVPSFFLPCCKYFGQKLAIKSKFGYCVTMKIFNLKDVVIALAGRPEILALISQIEFFRGRTFDLPKRIKLNRLHDLSKRRSVTSSNGIEGVVVSKAQEEALFDSLSDPETVEEKMLMGYNEALEHVFKVYPFQQLDEKFVLYLSELEWKLVNPLFGGNYKDHQNYIREYGPDGTSRTVFIPTKPEETPQTLGNLIWQFNDALSDARINRLVLIFVFVLDFLCIHPFNDGNGRVSRLLTTYFLLKYGYELDRYYSTSYLILKNLGGYYASLEKSSIGWHENENDYFPFLIYMLSVVLEGYKKLDYILRIQSEKGTLAEKILRIVSDSNLPVTKADIEEILFSNSRDSIEQALGKLVKDSKIQLLSKGKYAQYWRI